MEPKFSEQEIESRNMECRRAPPAEFLVDQTKDQTNFLMHNAQEKWQHTTHNTQHARLT